MTNITPGAYWVRPKDDSDADVQLAYFWQTSEGDSGWSTFGSEDSYAASALVAVAPAIAPVKTPERSPCTLENCGHMRQLDAIVDLLGMPRGTRSVLDELRARSLWEDAADEWTDAIKEAFPTRSGSHNEYITAMQMVQHRHSKSGLVALVNWLLVEQAKLRAEERVTKARLDGTTSAIPAIVNNHTKSYRADLHRFIAAYEQMRFRFGDEYEGRFEECDRMVELHLADKPLSGKP